MDGAQAKELGDRIDAHLRSMPYSEYLVTITAICEVLQDAYHPFLSDADIRLMSRTLTLLRSCSHSESTDIVNEAQRLWDDWSTTLDEPEEDGSEGWFAAVYTFQIVCAELAGMTRPCSCLAFLSQAGLLLPEPGMPLGLVGLVKVDLFPPPTSPAAEELLMRIERIAREGVAR